MFCRKCSTENVRQKMFDRQCLTENAGQKMFDRKCQTEYFQQKVTKNFHRNFLTANKKKSPFSMALSLTLTTFENFENFLSHFLLTCTLPAEISPIGFLIQGDKTQIIYNQGHKDEAQPRKRLIMICFNVLLSHVLFNRITQHNPLFEYFIRPKYRT